MAELLHSIIGGLVIVVNHCLTSRSLLRSIDSLVRCSPLCVPVTSTTPATTSTTTTHRSESAMDKLISPTQEPGCSSVSYCKVYDLRKLNYGLTYCSSCVTVTQSSLLLFLAAKRHFTNHSPTIELNVYR